MGVIHGQWEVTDGRNLGIDNPATLCDKRFVRSIDADGSEYVVAKVWGDGTGDYESTARLIAAAPELLNALERCNNRWDEADEQDNPSLGRAIRSAIAKATGGSE